MSIPFLKQDPLAHGAVEQVTPLVRRIVCNNPSAFTFRGTNTYIIGKGKVAVLDPGPEDAAHLEAILAATEGETITHVVVTHTHRDHSPGARPLVAATGAMTYASARMSPRPMPAGRAATTASTRMCGWRMARPSPARAGA